MRLLAARQNCVLLRPRSHADCQTGCDSTDVAPGAREHGETFSVAAGHVEWAVGEKSPRLVLIGEHLSVSGGPIEGPVNY